MFFVLQELHSHQRPESQITWDKVQKQTDEKLIAFLRAELQRKHRLHHLRKLHAKSLPYLMKLEKCGPCAGYVVKQRKRADRIYFKPSVEAKRLLNSKTLERRTFWDFFKIYQLLMMHILYLCYKTFCTHCAVLIEISVLQEPLEKPY